MAFILCIWHQVNFHLYYLLIGDAIEVYCQDEWIVLERRTNADLEFNQTWSTYADGFGDLNDG